MREAVGSTFLFNIMIIFIFFFASFLAIAINYSQAFRVKNQIINYIEQYEGLNETSEEKIVQYASNSGYYKEITCDCDSGGVGNNYNCGTMINDNKNGGAIKFNGNTAKGVCIRKLKNADDETYYRVTTFVKFNLPIIGDFFTFEVKGETKLITND